MTVQYLVRGKSFLLRLLLLPLMMLKVPTTTVTPPETEPMLVAPVPVLKDVERLPGDC